jgi:zinc resistance-associated protein
MKIQANKILIALAVTILFGVGTVAYADWGSGCGYHGRGYGHHGMDKNNRGCAYRSDLSDEDTAALEKERDAFRAATEDLRKNIYDKKLALRDELGMEKPDAEKASKLQKELSALESAFDQKRVEHIIRMKEIDPDMGRNYARKGRGGHGRSNGGGNCWQ